MTKKGSSAQLSALEPYLRRNTKMDNFLSNLFSETNHIADLYIQLNHGSTHKVETTFLNGNKTERLRDYKLIEFYAFIKEVEKYVVFLLNNGEKIRKISIKKNNLDLFEFYIIFINSYKELAEYKIFAEEDSLYDKVKRLLDNLVNFMSFVQVNLKKKYVNEETKR